MRWPRVPGIHSLNMANLIYCCSPTTAFRSATPMKAMTTRSAVAIRRVSWFQRLVCRRKSHDDLPVSLWPRTLADAVYRRNVKMLAEKGTRHIQVMCPGFAADCLETLEEIAVQNREIFLEAGGKQYEYIPALNATPEHIEMMVKLTAAYR